MIYITSQAILTKNPVIEVGNSLTAFMRKLGIDKTGGEKGGIIHSKKQMYSLAGLRMSLGMSFLISLLL